MVRHTQALTSSQPLGRAVPDAAPESVTSLPILQIAINLVFGTPFLACLFVALRWNIGWGYRLLDSVHSGTHPYVWTMAAALGALWLGVSLVLHRVRARRPAGALLVLAGSALIVLLNA